MKTRLLVATAMLLVLMSSAKAAENDITIGSRQSIYSEVLGEEREYWVYLPGSYAGAKDYTRYPVMYLPDGGKLFHAVTGAIHQMSSDATPQIPEMIVVGIASQQRIRDSSPTRSLIGYEGKEEPGLEVSGGADDFLTFVRAELIPEIEASYSTSDYRLLTGYSFTGLAVLQALYTIPNIFHAYLAIDPSLWWDDAVMLRTAETRLSSHDFDRKVLFMATTGRVPVSIWPEENFVIRYSQLLESLDVSGLTLGFTRYGLEENHHTIPMIAVYDGLNFVFDGYMLTQGFQHEHSPTDLESHFAAVSARLGAGFLPPESVVDFYAGDLMYSRLHPNLERGIGYFELNTRSAIPGYS